MHFKFISKECLKISCVCVLTFKKDFQDFPPLYSSTELAFFLKEAVLSLALPTFYMRCHF